MKPKSCSLVKQNQHAKIPSYRPIVIFRLFFFQKSKNNFMIFFFSRKCKSYLFLTLFLKKFIKNFIFLIFQIEVEIRIEKVDLKPEYAITEFIKEAKPKFVVTGTRGVGVIRRTILGSTSDFILHHVCCPVVICNMDD